MKNWISDPTPTRPHLLMPIFPPAVGASWRHLPEKRCGAGRGFGQQHLRPCLRLRAARGLFQGDDHLVYGSERFYRHQSDSDLTASNRIGLYPGREGGILASRFATMFPPGTWSGKSASSPPQSKIFEGGCALGPW